MPSRGVLVRIPSRGAIGQSYPRWRVGDWPESCRVQAAPPPPYDIRSAIDTATRVLSASMQFGRIRMSGTRWPPRRVGPGAAVLLGLCIAGLLFSPAAEGATTVHPTVRIPQLVVIPTALAWTNISGNYSTPQVQEAAMTYDAHDHYMLLFGGASPSGFRNATWAFTGHHWHNLHLSVAPTPRRGAAMTYDPIDGYVVLFGGTAVNSNVGLSDTWAFTNGSWTLLLPSTSPSPRAGASMVYNPALK